MRNNGDDVAVSLMLFGLLLFSSWAVYYYQFEDLPSPLSPEQAGDSGFSEVEAMKHARALTQLGPHSIGSDSLDHALQYVLKTAENIKKTAPGDVNVEVDLFHAKSSAHHLESDKGKTLVYSDLNHVLLRILPKNASQRLQENQDDEAYNAIFVSTHVDTVFSSEGGGSSSDVSVMLELARAMSHSDVLAKNGIIFFFNTGEEEGLNGAHSFITQHPWSSTVTVAVDLEALGIGGKSGIFQAGPDPSAVGNFASAVKYPSGNVVAQDLFSSGVIKSSTDFQVYKEIGGLSGLDFAFTDKSAVYHTKNDKFELLKPGSLQHLGENMLAFLLQASTTDLPGKATRELKGKSGEDSPIYFDILGKYMIVYDRAFASILNNSVIGLSIIVLIASLVMGGFEAAISLGLSCLSAITTLASSISFAIVVAFILPQISSSPVPYVAKPWLVIGLFAAPALIGALTGQHFGYLALQKYLSNVHCKRKLLPVSSSVIEADSVKLEAEGWLVKAGFLQWLVLLILGNYYGIGSSYVALFWLVPPAFAYGLLESTQTTAQLPRTLKLATLLSGFAAPIVVSAGTFIRLVGTLIGTAVQSDGNLGNILVSASIAAIICFTLVNILSYVHLSGATSSIILTASLLFGLSLFSTLYGIVPAFTEDIGRPVNVVHVVDATESYGNKHGPTSYVSIFSTTPGDLTKVAGEVDEGFSCGKDKVVDFVTFSVEYGCVAYEDAHNKLEWSNANIPTLHVNSNIKGDDGSVQVSIDTKNSIRWSLAINTNEVEDFVLTAAGNNNSEVLVPKGSNMASIDGWHTIQFSGGKKAPTKYRLTLFWASSNSSSSMKSTSNSPLLKLRTDFDRVTPKVQRVLNKLPNWCTLYGDSTVPYTQAFLTSLTIDHLYPQKTVGLVDH